MASAAEQLAANLNFSALAKAEELKKRIWFTLGALLVYRFGTYIPLPGIDPSVWEQIFQTQAGGILGMFNMFSGGGIHRMAIFALNIMPYISASIIIQLMTTVSPTLEQLKKEGEQGRKMMNQYTRYLTVVLAAFQSYGIAIGLEGAGNVVTDPGLFFRISTVITLTGGTMFLMWLGEQITARGIGNGTSLIIMSGIVARAAVGDRRRPSSSAARARSRHGLILAVHRGGGRGDRLHRVHGAGAAPAVDPVSQAAGRQPHVRGPVLAPAAQAQHLGRDPADLRVLAAAAAGHGRELQRRRRARLVHHHHLAARPRPAAVPDASISGSSSSSPSSTPRSCSTRPRPRTTSRSTAASSPASGRASAPPNTSTTCSRASPCIGAGYLALVCLMPGNPDLLSAGPVLFRRHLAPDRGQRDHGHGGADPGLPAGASV